MIYSILELVQGRSKAMPRSWPYGTGSRSAGHPVGPFLRHPLCCNAHATRPGWHLPGLKSCFSTEVGEPPLGKGALGVPHRGICIFTTDHVPECWSFPTAVPSDEGASTEQRQLNVGEREECALCPATTLGKALIPTLPNFQVLDLAA